MKYKVNEHVSFITKGQLGHGWILQVKRGLFGSKYLIGYEENIRDRGELLYKLRKATWFPESKVIDVIEDTDEEDNQE